MTLVQLEYTLAVAQYKNFTIAAERSFVTQPTLSMQVQKLESELGVEIFDRSTHPISITKIGEKIIEQAKNIVAEAKNMEHLVLENQNSLSGTINLGIIPTILPTLVPLFYKNFTSKFPNIELNIKELKTEEVIFQLKEGEIDFGILSTPLYEENIVENPMYYEPLMAFIPNGNALSSKKKVSIDEVQKEEILVLEKGNCFRNNVINLCDNSVSQNSPVHIDSGSFQTLVNLSKDGFGLTLLPLLYSETLSPSDQKFLKGFSDPVPTREVSLVYSNTQIRTSFIVKFIELIQGIIRGKLFLESENITLPKLQLS